VCACVCRCLHAIVWKSQTCAVNCLFPSCVLWEMVGKIAVFLAGWHEYFSKVLFAATETVWHVTLASVKTRLNLSFLRTKTRRAKAWKTRLGYHNYIHYRNDCFSVSRHFVLNDKDMLNIQIGITSFLFTISTQFFACMVGFLGRRIQICYLNFLGSKEICHGNQLWAK